MKSRKQDFIQIIDHHHGIINSLCKVYYKGVDDQKDAYQDVVAQLWKSFPTFQGRSKMSTWIYRVSLNTLLTKRRNEKRKISTQSIDNSEQHEYATYMADDSSELLGIILSVLNDLDKGIIILHLEGYKYQEIGDLLGQSPTNVSTRMNRIKQKLHSKFNKSSDEIRRS